MSERETATGDLGLGQAFVNTVDLMPGEEQLRDPNTLQAWLVANRLLGPEQPVDEGDWKHALAVREAIRGVIGANTGLRVFPVDLATLNEAAGASRLRMRFGSGGKARLEPEAADGLEISSDTAACRAGAPRARRSPGSSAGGRGRSSVRVWKSPAPNTTAVK